MFRITTPIKVPNFTDTFKIWYWLYTERRIYLRWQYLTDWNSVVEISVGTQSPLLECTRVSVWWSVSWVVGIQIRRDRGID